MMRRSSFVALVGLAAVSLSAAPDARQAAPAGKPPAASAPAAASAKPGASAVVYKSPT
jgi:hypothetical protein